VSQPTAPRQKPRAKLRDSFIHQPQDSQPDKRLADDLTDTRVVSQRACSLRAIIQKHENIAHGKKDKICVYFIIFHSLLILTSCLFRNLF
jgi:hypothetical protein